MIARLKRTDEAEFLLRRNACKHGGAFGDFGQLFVRNFFQFAT
jgi:hypothetical protein